MAGPSGVWYIAERMSLAPLGSGFHERILRVLRELGDMPEPSPELVRSLATLCDLTVTWNSKLDLTAAKDADELVDLVVADAALVQRHHSRRGAERWVDVGSGSGAPGLPLALCLPEAHFTLVEPKQKRVAFLRTALGTLARSDVRVERARVEALTPGAFDIAISRATLSPETWLEEGARIAASAVWVLLSRREPPTVAGFQLDLDIAYVWPLTNAERRAVRFVREA